MNGSRAFFLAAGLALAACSTTPDRHAASSGASLTVHVVEASGGG